MGQIIKLGAGDVEAVTPTASTLPGRSHNVISLNADEVEPVAPTDMGANARRALAGKAPGEQQHSDAELGLDPGAVNDIYVNPLVARAFPSVADAMRKQPSTAAESASKAKLAGLVQ